MLNPEPFHINESVTYEKKPVKILTSELRVLRNQVINLVKVLWRNQKLEEVNWERKEEMKAKYPELFE